MVSPMSQARLGRAAELVFQAKCLMEDLECYCPTTAEGRVDVIVGPHRYRCQIKLMAQRTRENTAKYLPLSKQRGQRGSRSRFRYTEADVDFMIGVCLESRAIYVVPIASTSDHSISIAEHVLLRMETLQAFYRLRSAPEEEPLPLEARPISSRRTRPSRHRSHHCDEASLPLGLEVWREGDASASRAGSRHLSGPAAFAASDHASH